MMDNDVFGQRPHVVIAHRVNAVSASVKLVLVQKMAIPDTVKRYKPEVQT
jgi:hypothetical protein